MGILDPDRDRVYVEDDSAWYLYFVQCVCVEAPIKVGRTRNVRARLSAMQVGNPFELRDLGSFVCGMAHSAAAAERYVHRKLDRFFIRGEWFSRDAEPFVMAAIAAIRARVRGQSVNEALREDWNSGDIIDEALNRRAARIAAFAAGYYDRKRRRRDEHRAELRARRATKTGPNR